MRRTKKPVIPPSFVAAGNAGSNFNEGGGSFNTFINLPKPAGVAVGDLLLAYVVFQGSTSTVITPPAGWTTDIGSVSGRLYTHVVAAGDPSSWQWTTSSAFWFSGSIAAYRNAVIDVKAFTDQPTFPYTGADAPAVTTTQPNELVVHFWSFMEGNGVNASIGLNNPGTTTLRDKWRTASNHPSGIPVLCADEVKAVAGAVPVRSATLDDGSVGGNWSGNPFSIGLKGV